ncbi:aminotransferase class IV family protein [Arcobacter sp. s6]|uniref:aminotransferase class IV family protein n=1 Tax=Arcobacter sp. s6 TaxID=3230363 RepID=UPI0034A092EE
MEEIKYFETIKCDDYEIFNLDYHNKRVANTIGLNFNLQEYIYPLSADLLRCKIIYNKDEIIDVQYFPYEKKEINSFKLVYDDINYSKKYLNRDTLDKLYEQKNDCDDVIIIKNNIVTDTSIANIAIFYENQWITSKNCLLKGTTRDRLINDKFLIEKDISVKMLKKASKIALMNAMIGFDIKEDYSFSE